MSSKLESDVCCRLQVAPSGERYEGKTQARQKATSDYCWVYGVIHFTSPAGWLPVHRDQLRAQRSVTSMGKLYLFTLNFSLRLKSTRSTGTTDGPRNVMCQPKCCQLLHRSVETICTSPEQIEVMELKGYSRPTYNNLVHSAMTRSTILGVIHRLDHRRVCWLHHQLAVAKFFKSRVWGTVPEGSNPCFWRYASFLITHYRIDQRKLYPSSRFDTILACDGQMDKRSDAWRQYIPC